MNLKEYLFYSNKNATTFADMVHVSHDYMRCIIRGAKPLSKKFAYTIELATNGVVKKDQVLGPPTHPDAAKILELSKDNS